MYTTMNSTLLIVIIGTIMTISLIIIATIIDKPSNKKLYDALIFTVKAVVIGAMLYSIAALIIKIINA